MRAEHSSGTYRAISDAVDGLRCIPTYFSTWLRGAIAAAPSDRLSDFLAHRVGTLQRIVEPLLDSSEATEFGEICRAARDAGGPARVAELLGTRAFDDPSAVTWQPSWNLRPAARVYDAATTLLFDGAMSILAEPDNVTENLRSRRSWLIILSEALAQLGRLDLAASAVAEALMLGELSTTSFEQIVRSLDSLPTVEERAHALHLVCVALLSAGGWRIDQVLALIEKATPTATEIDAARERWEAQASHERVDLDVASSPLDFRFLMVNTAAYTLATRRGLPHLGAELLWAAVDFSAEFDAAQVARWWQLPIWDSTIRNSTRLDCFRHLLGLDWQSESPRPADCRKLIETVLELDQSAEHLTQRTRRVIDMLWRNREGASSLSALVTAYCDHLRYTHAPAAANDAWALNSDAEYVPLDEAPTRVANELFEACFDLRVCSGEYLALRRGVETSRLARLTVTERFEALTCLAYIWSTLSTRGAGAARTLLLAVLVPDSQSPVEALQCLLNPAKSLLHQIPRRSIRDRHVSALAAAASRMAHDLQDPQHWNEAVHLCALSVGLMADLDLVVPTPEQLAEALRRPRDVPLYPPSVMLSGVSGLLVAAGRAGQATSALQLLTTWIQSPLDQLLELPLLRGVRPDQVVSFAFGVISVLWHAGQPVTPTCAALADYVRRNARTAAARGELFAFVSSVQQVRPLFVLIGVYGKESQEDLDAGRVPRFLFWLEQIENTSVIAGFAPWENLVIPVPEAGLEQRLSIPPEARWLRFLFGPQGELHWFVVDGERPDALVARGRSSPGARLRIQQALVAHERYVELAWDHYHAEFRVDPTAARRARRRRLEDAIELFRRAIQAEIDLQTAFEAPSRGLPDLIIKADDALGAAPFALLDVGGVPLWRRVASITESPRLGRAGPATSESPRRMFCAWWLGERSGAAESAVPAFTEDLRASAFEKGWDFQRFDQALQACGGAIEAAIGPHGLPTALAVIAAHGSADGRALELSDGNWPGPRAPLQQLKCVALLACHGGRMMPHAPLELGGIVSAFLAAGVRCVLAPKWPVEDAEASRFLADCCRRMMSAPFDGDSPFAVGRAVHDALCTWLIQAARDGTEPADRHVRAYFSLFS